MGKYLNKADVGHLYSEASKVDSLVFDEAPQGYDNENYGEISKAETMSSYPSYGTKPVMTTDSKYPTAYGTNPGLYVPPYTAGIPAYQGSFQTGAQVGSQGVSQNANPGNLKKQGIVLFYIQRRLPEGAMFGNANNDIQLITDYKQLYASEIENMNESGYGVFLVPCDNNSRVEYLPLGAN